MVSISRLTLGLVFIVATAACSGPTVSRGGEDESIDQAALSTRLDRVDLEGALDDWYEEFQGSGFIRNLSTDNRRSISVLQIKNETSQHIASGLKALIKSVETKVVNDGVLDVISNDQIAIDAIAGERLRGDAVDPETMARLGKELGVHYFIYGNVGEVTEKLSDKKRVQYFLFLTVVEVETRRNVFQMQVDITKQIAG